jgi:cytoskeletal protein RodZ
MYTVFTILALFLLLGLVVVAVNTERHRRTIALVSVIVLLTIVGIGSANGLYDTSSQTEVASSADESDDESDDDSDYYDDESDDSEEDTDYTDESSDTTSDEDDTLDEDTDDTEETDTTSASSSSVVAASSSSYSAPAASSSSYRAPSASSSSRVTNGYRTGGGRSYDYKPVPQTGQSETVYVSARIPGRYHKDPNCRGLQRYGGAQAVSLARAQQMGYSYFCAYERYGN